MRAELRTAHAQLQSTAAERDAARAEALAATKHVAALQDDLRATDRMEKVRYGLPVGESCRYARSHRVPLHTLGSASAVKPWLGNV